MGKKRGLFLLFRLFLRRVETFFLAPYRQESKAVRANLRLLLTVLLLCQVALVLSGIPALATTNIAGTGAVIVVLFVFFPFLLWLLRSGKRHLVVTLFAIVVTLLVSLVHLFSAQTGFEVHKLDRFAVQILVQLVLLAAITEKATSLLVSSGLFFVAYGCLTFVILWPLAGEHQEALLVSFFRVLFNVSLAGGVLAFLQQALHRAVREVELANRTLEARVVRRTEQLQVAQRNLVEGERLAVIGRLSASVAHEINTPLGAIQSSSQTIRTQVPEVLTRAVSLFRRLTAEQEEILIDLLDQSLCSPTVEGLERRRLRKTLIQNLEESGCPDAQGVGEHLVDAGVFEVPESWKPLLTGPDAPEVGQFLYDFAAVLRAGRIVDAATQKASQYIVSLRQFIQDQQALEPGAITDLVAGIEAVLTLLASQAPPTVRIVKEFSLGLKVKGQASRLMQVWSNLVLHAFEAMKEGGVLGVKIQQEATMAVVTISDTGPGIPESHRESLFDTVADDRPFGVGSGMDLSFVRAIVFEHDGQVAFESGPGSTKFVVRLPLATEKES